MRHETKENITLEIRLTRTGYDNFTGGVCSLTDNNVINHSLYKHRSALPTCRWQYIFAFCSTRTKVLCPKRASDWSVLDPQQPNELHILGQTPWALLATLKQTQHFTLQMRTLLGISSTSCEKSPKVIWPRTTWLEITENQQAACLIQWGYG